MTREKALSGMRCKLTLLTSITLLAACAGQGGVPPASIAPQAGETRLAVGDALRIMVWQHPELSGDFVVGRDSTLVHPVYQSVKVGGQTQAVARDRIRALLVTYEQGVQLTVEPLWPVAVVGEVRLPTLYHFPPGTTVAEAVALAGGPTDRGKMHDVKVVGRQGRKSVDLTVDDARTRNIMVASGDQVHVPRRSEFVNNVVVPVTGLLNAVISLIILSQL
jgi:polysaccharide export outer membrane protein